MYTIAVTEGHQGKHRYFTGSVPVGELEHIVKFPEDLGDLDEDEQMQRSIAKRRIGDLVEYLTSVDDHFFSAVTLMILPRSLDRPAVLGDLDDDQDDGEYDYAFERAQRGPHPGKVRQGWLHLGGDVMLFPADGQHRLYAEFDAMKSDSSLAKEELPVVFLPYESADQVRQLFSDLNLNAKPISKTLALGYESRDPMALLAKAVAPRVSLFRDRLNLRTNSLPRSSANVITLNTLVQGCRDLVEGFAGEDKNDQRAYLGPKNFDQAVAQVTAAWEDIIEPFSDHWDKVTADEITPGELREEYLFPHGLGWRALASAAGELIAADPDNWAAKFARGVGAYNWARTAPEWEGNAVIHDRDKESNRVNNTDPGINQLKELILKAAG